MIKKTRYNLLVKIVFQVLEISISIALVNEHSHAPVTLTKLICLRQVFWSVVRCLRRGRDISSLLYGIVLHTLVVVLTYHQ